LGRSHAGARHHGAGHLRYEAQWCFACGCGWWNTGLPVECGFGLCLGVGLRCAFGFGFDTALPGAQVTKRPVHPAVIAWSTAASDGFGVPSGYSRPDCQPPEVGVTSRFASSTRWKKSTSETVGSHEYICTTRA